MFLSVGREGGSRFGYVWRSEEIDHCGGLRVWLGQAVELLLDAVSIVEALPIFLRCFRRFVIG
jgi:hypothetical protein